MRIECNEQFSIGVVKPDGNSVSCRCCCFRLLLFWGSLSDSCVHELVSFLSVFVALPGRLWKRSFPLFCSPLPGIAGGLVSRPGRHLFCPSTLYDNISVLSLCCALTVHLFKELLEEVHHVFVRSNSIPRPTTRSGRGRVLSAAICASETIACSFPVSTVLPFSVEVSNPPASPKSACCSSGLSAWSSCSVT